MNELALFAGAGGGILGGRLLGWRTVCAVELDDFAASVLVARQNDGTIEPFPIWDDVRTFDGRPWRGRVDVVSGGFPCQDISAAGKGEGIDGARSGLWVEMARIIDEVRPRFAFVENSPLLVRRGLVRVLGDLACMGYDARWGIVGAHDAGAPHLRRRIWIVASDAERDGLRHEQQRPRCRRIDVPTCRKTIVSNDGAAWDVADSYRGRCEVVRQSERADKQSAQRNEPNGCRANVADTNSAGREEQRSEKPDGAQHAAAERGGWWETEPALGRVADEVADRVGQLRALGNGQVPAVVALAWSLLNEP